MIEVKLHDCSIREVRLSGLDALSAAQDLYGENPKAGYPTPKIAVSGDPMKYFLNGGQLLEG